MVFEADELKLIRIDEPSQFDWEVISSIGVKPPPKRKKSFWRAFRRKEVVAIVSPKTYSSMTEDFIKMFKRIDYSVFCPNEEFYMIRENK